MARPRGFPHRIQGRPRRKSSWGFGPDANGITISTEDVNTIWTNGIVLTQENKVTITRIHGLFHIVLTAVNSAASGFRGAMGFGIVNEEAFTAGVDSLPHPVADAQWTGWMWHQRFDVRSITAAIADGSNAGAIHQRGMIDVKAQRIFGANDVLFGVIEADNETGTAILRLDADTRMLVLLS